MSANLTRKALLAGAAGVALEAAGGKLVPGAQAAAAPLLATPVSGALPLTDPASKLWNRAKAVKVPVFAQQMAQPFLAKAGVSSLQARALWNGKELGFLLEWADRVADEQDGLYRFHDAVAAMLPVKASKTPPPFTMGAPGMTVHIVQWRASWQHDIERGGGPAERVAELFPRVIRDEPPQKLLPPKVAELWSPGLSVGNPMSAVRPASAVNELVAASFGSATTVTTPSAKGWGTHGSGGWRVALGLPADRNGVGDPIKAGSVWPVAFAVWLGSADNRGGRKHWANWVNFGIPKGAA